VRENWKLGLTIAAALLYGVGTARADAIDGNWCNGDGRHFSINGATIVTTEGTKTDGNYSRHAFSYTIPSPDLIQLAFLGVGRGDRNERAARRA
jgi:hypothetical protein